MGAVRIYNPVKAAVLVAAVVLLIGGLGFLGGILAGGGDGDSNDSEAAAQTRTVTEQTSGSPDDDPGSPSEEETGERSSEPDGRAYRRGFRAGAAAALGSIDSQGAYVVRVERSNGGARLRVTQDVPVEEGEQYYLCEGGRRLCIGR